MNDNLPKKKNTAINRDLGLTKAYLLITKKTKKLVKLVYGKTW